MIQNRLDGTPEERGDGGVRRQTVVLELGPNQRPPSAAHPGGVPCALPKLLERAVGILLEAVNDDIRRQVRRSHAIATYEARTRGRRG